LGTVLEVEVYNVLIRNTDFLAFIDLLKDIVDMWNARIAADANLSRCMRHINGVYTQRFNRAHASDGLLFRGGRASGMEEREA